MAGTGANVVLARATLEVIKANPEGWAQQHWRCKTGMCFAGHAAVLAGAEFVVPASLIGSHGTYFEIMPGDRTPVDYVVELVRHDSIAEPRRTWAESSARYVELPHVTSIKNFARQALGLDDTQAEALFEGGNTLADLERMVAALEADPNADLDAFLDPDDD